MQDMQQSSRGNNYTYEIWVIWASLWHLVTSKKNEEKRSTASVRVHQQQNYNVVHGSEEDPKHA